MIRTEQLTEAGRLGIAHNSATEFDDYLPRHEKVEFDNGENEKTISIKLVNDKMIQHIDGKTIGNKVDQDDMDVDQQGHHEELQDVMFKIKLEKAEPQGVKISKKNVCLVTIVQNEDAQRDQDDHAKLMDYFMQSQEKSWSTQMKDAVKLGPCIDEDNLIVDDVTLSEGLFHFMCIGWKVIFATIPPPDMGGGAPAFAVALVYIGLVTMLVGEVATILGCAVGVKASITAISLVAMGTSLPDTFASMTAAK
jgi:solute carrier family 8 (sodium/calcium exchanger)